MAKETVKTIGLIVTIVALLLSVVGSVVGISWAGSSRLTKVETKAENNEKNHTEHLKEDKEFKSSTSAKMSDYEKQSNEKALRDARLEAQYDQITLFMRQQADKIDNMHKEQKSNADDTRKAIAQMQMDLSTTKTKVDFLTKESEDAQD